MSNQAAAQRDQLWANITRTAIEVEPYGQWLQQGRWEDTMTPSLEVAAKMAEVADKRAKQKAQTIEAARKKRAKEKLQENLKKGGALVHRAIKSAMGAKKRMCSPHIL